MTDIRCDCCGIHAKDLVELMCLGQVKRLAATPETLLIECPKCNALITIRRDA